VENGNIKLFGGNDWQIFGNKLNGWEKVELKNGYMASKN
jgi:hypothetical protein